MSRSNKKMEWILVVKPEGIIQTQHHFIGTEEEAKAYETGFCDGLNHLGVGNVLLFRDDGKRLQRR